MWTQLLALQVYPCRVLRIGLVSGGVDTFFASTAVPAATAGSVLEALTFEVPLSSWTGEFAVVVDDDGSGVGAVEECHEDDNRSGWLGELCD